LFLPEFRTAATAIAGAWNYYRAGHIDLDQVRNYIEDLAGGMKPPEWVSAMTTETTKQEPHDPISETLRIHGIPVTRENWIDVAWPRRCASSMD
jgi:hypothetical protein